MTAISVREHDAKKEKPKADNTDPERARRRKVMAEKRKYRKQVDAEGAPKAVVFQRIVVQMSAPDEQAWECPTCICKPWKWQAECPRCGTARPK